jgi:putative DNA primase/helicase
MKFSLSELNDDAVSAINDAEIAAGQQIDRAVEIERLAALDTAQYEVARTDAAGKLGFRASVLDKLRDEKRRELLLDNTKDDVGQGRRLEFPEVLPWSDPIEGDRVASALSATFKRYVRMSDSQADVCALMVLLSWTIEKFSIAPRLCVTSPTKGCGKSTLLELFGRLAYRPLMSGSVTPAALFRAIELYHPTFMLDENEKFLEPGSDFHAILNQGHRRGQYVIRTQGDDHELRMFDTFCLVAFARNGRPPDDLEQRSIVIELERRLPGEQLDVLKDSENLDNLRRMCLRWADDYADDLAGTDPDMGGLINRVADNWRPLFTLADLIESDWPNRIRDASAALLPKRDGDSNDTILLADIRTIFNEAGADRLSSEQICEALVAIEGHPWAEYGKSGKPITKNKLAHRLDRFKIVPNTISIGGKTAKGYHRHQFEEGWKRYLSSTPQDPPNETSQRNNADEMGTSCTSQNVTEKSVLRFESSEKPPSNGHCYVVTFQNPPLGAGEGISEVCGHCGKPGDLREIAYGEFSSRLHRDCEVAWMADCDEA